MHKNWLSRLLSSGSDVSSKRTASLFTLLMVIIMAFIAVISDEHHICPEFMYDSLCLMAGSGMGMTILDKLIEKRKG
jgi:hypothetical protein